MSKIIRTILYTTLALQLVKDESLWFIINFNGLMTQGFWEQAEKWKVGIMWEVGQSGFRIIRAPFLQEEWPVILVRSHDVRMNGLLLIKRTT